MSWLIFGCSIVLVLGLWWLIFDLDIKASVDQDLRNHVHGYRCTSACKQEGAGD